MSVLASATSFELNGGWSFYRGDVQGAEKPDFNDSDWRHVSVPHDWSIEDLPGQANPFDEKAPFRADQGYMLGGIGWYRRIVTLPADVATKTVLLRFQAVFMDARIWINGELIARHPYGYSAFVLDISAKAMPGANVIAIQVNNQAPSSRWYSGSGIIRPVHLDMLDKLHIDPLGPVITTPEVAEAEATVRVVTAVTNGRADAVQASLTSIILDPNSRELRRSVETLPIAAGGSATFNQQEELVRPALWSIESPALHTLVQELRFGDVLIDSRRTKFGVRSISFDAKTGFLLNGKHVLLKGGAIHDDNYMLGAAGVPRADARKVELMKAAGFNAIRSAHNPASQATLEAADRLGMLVIDEAFDAWTVPKRENDYSRFFKDNWQSGVAS